MFGSPMVLVRTAKKLVNAVMRWLLNVAQVSNVSDFAFFDDVEHSSSRLALKKNALYDYVLFELFEFYT